MSVKHPTKEKPSPSNGSIDQKKIISIIDKSLKHLNHISEANIVAQQLYIELLKEEKTMKFDQIKKIYLTLTEGKAKEILFQRDKKELIQTDYQNHESLIRLCWRSIQKLIKKITYYMINQNHLSVISNSTLKLIHLNQQFVRKFQKLKNSSMTFIIEIIEKLIQENSILETKIYDILLTRGYVVSLDQFYKLNGCDAQHSEAYFARKEKNEKQSSEDQETNKIAQPQTQLPSSQAKHKFNKKKKGFRLDNRYSWREKFKLEEIEEKQSFPSNKTNYQIKQSFEKFIGDFLQNQNLKEILTYYKFQDNNPQKKQADRLKKENIFHQESLIEKKIFESKIASVLSQLKSNNLKFNAKLLEVIDNSSTQAINQKLNLIEKKNISRKNIERINSGIGAERKLRKPHVLNDRKIVNQNFFRSLLRNNTTLQHHVNQQIFSDANKIKDELYSLTFQAVKVNPYVIQFTKMQHNQNNFAKNVKKSRFSQAKENEIFLFNSQAKTTEEIYRKKTSKLFQTDLNRRYQMKSKDKVGLRVSESMAEKICNMKEWQQLKNENKMLNTIEKDAIDPRNPMKLAEILYQLNNRKSLQVDPLLKELIFQRKRKKGLVGSQFHRLNRQSGQNFDVELKIKDFTCQFDPNGETIHSNTRAIKRVRTELSPRKLQGSKDKKLLIQNWKQNQTRFEVFDTRLRRMIRR